MVRIAFLFFFWGVSVTEALAQGAAADQLSLPELDRQLAVYTDLIASKTATNSQQALELFRQVRDSMSSGKTTLAIAALETLAARRGGQGEGGARTWLRLAAAWRSQIAASPRCEAPAEASIAAYGAYKKAATDADRIEALSILGALFLQAAGQENSETVSCRPLNEVATATENADLTREGARRQAYRVFTRLGQLAGNDRVGDTITRLSEFSVDRVTYPPPYAVNVKKGTRCDAVSDQPATSPSSAPSSDIQIVNPQCEENAGNQTCVVFNRNLESPKPDGGGRFIRLKRLGESGANADTSSRMPDEVRDDRACFFNLRAGAGYELSVSKSLKSIDGIALRKDVQSILQIPDSPQSLGYQAETYVLPAKGPRKITLRTMNVRKADIALRRLGDRNLVRDLVYKKIVGALDDTSKCFILQQIGERIADGTVVVAGKRNEIAPVELPIGEILDDRREWLTSNPRGGTKTWANANLSLTISGDQASTGATRQAGVFALFGNISGKVGELWEGNNSCPSNIESQWFSVTNLGVTLQRGPTEMYVVVRELDTGLAAANATVELIARNGARLAAVTTDVNGIGPVPARLGRGAGGNELVAVMATLGNDFAVLDLTAGALDLSDRGFEGRGALNELDGFVVPTRGVYRPGETIQSLIFVRGPDGRTSRALNSFEVILSRGDGSVIARQQFVESVDPTKFAADGGFLADLEIPAVTPEGSFELAVFVGDRKVGSTPIDIRNFQPHTIRIDRGSWSGAISESGSMEISGSATANYLYGERQNNAPAANLRAELDIRVEAAKTPKPGCYEDFTFGRSREEFRAQLFRDSAISTDSRGRLEYRKTHEKVLRNSVPLRASIGITLLDPNGKAAETRFDVALAQHGPRWIGLRFRGGPAGILSQPALVDAVAFDDNSAQERPQLWYSIYREQNSFVWYKDGGSWDFTSPSVAREAVAERIPISSRPQLAEQTASCAEPFSFPVPFERPGNYIVVVFDDKGAITELPVSYGWTTSPNGALKPDALRVWTQAKSSFLPGEKLDISVSTPHQSGRILAQIFVNGAMKAKFDGDIGSKKEFNVKVDVDKTWPQGGAHIYATSFRKADKNNDSYSNGPGRAIGGTFVTIGSATKAKMTISAPQLRTTSSMNQNIEIPVTVENLRGDTSVVLAIADEGVLLVTDYKTPDPYEHYFGKRRFDFDIFDSYGRIIYGKVGGDNVLAPLRGVGYRADEIVSWRSSIQKTSNGRVIFQIPAGTVKPNFDGQIRVMAWAWNADSFVSSEQKFTVSDRFRVRISAPRSMAPGDIASVPLQARHLSGPEIGQMTVEVRAAPPLALDNPATESQAQACDQVSDRTKCLRILVQPRKDADWENVIRVRAGTETGSGVIGIQYALDGEIQARSWEVPVVSPHARIAQIVAQETIAPGATKIFGSAEFDNMARGFDSSSVSIAAKFSGVVGSPDAGQYFQDEITVRQLDQLAHQAQLLLVSELSPKDGRSGSPSIGDNEKRRLATLIRELSALQGSDGGFASDGQMTRRFHNPGRPYEIKETSVAETAFALDVLSRASASGVSVPPSAIDRGVGFLLSEFQSLLDPQSKCTRAHRYALAVMVRMDRIASGSFRTVAATCASDVSQIDRLLLASAYNTFGFSTEAKKILADAELDQKPLAGENSAEKAQAIALVLESHVELDPNKMIDKIGLKVGDTYDLATASWVNRANRAAVELLSGKFLGSPSISVTPPQIVKRVLADGVELEPLLRSSIPGGGVRIFNAGPASVVASFLANGVPRQIAATNNSVFNLRVKINGVFLDDKPITVKQFNKVYVEIELNQRRNDQGTQRLSLVEVLPTGFEGMDKIIEPEWSNTNRSSETVGSKLFGVPEWAMDRGAPLGRRGLTQYAAPA